MRISKLFCTFAATILLSACTTTAVEYPTTCTLPTPVADGAAAPGAEAWATGGGLSSVNDTVLTVGSAQAEVIAVTRNGCDDLDTCRTDNGCGVCLDCDACAAEEAACVERVNFRVPALQAGDHPLIVLNEYGTSGTGTLTVLGSDTGDTADTGDTGGHDTADTGGTDTGGTDTGATDTGGTDTGATDTGAPPPSCAP